MWMDYYCLSVCLCVVSGMPRLVGFEGALLRQAVHQHGCQKMVVAGPGGPATREGNCGGYLSFSAQRGTLCFRKSLLVIMYTGRSNTHAAELLVKATLYMIIS